MEQKEWKVVYQKVPYNYTDPATLVIRAESREAAFATAYDHLSRRGNGVYVHAGDITKLGVDADAVFALGVPTHNDGRVHILRIDEHAVKVTGTVVGAA